MIVKFATAAGPAGALLPGLAVPSFAAANDEAREETALLNTALTLSQAISSAEQQTGGKAFDAGVDVDHGKPCVVVETNGPKGVETVIIDARNGQIIGGHKGGEAD